MKKFILIGLAVLVAAGLVIYMVVRQQSGYTKVYTAKIAKQELASVVSGTGQIKPKTYVNVGATSFGRITRFFVKEGDHVKKGQTLATIENVQQESSVRGQEANISAGKTDINSYLAAEKTAEANVDRSKADLEQKKLDWDRAQQLFKGGIMSRQDYDARKAAYDLALAALAQTQAQLNQAKAQTESARAHLRTAESTLRANQDLLAKTIAIAPFDGLVTNEPVREGETVVEGIQNALGSTLMTIADMSIVTAEVKVDETDILNVKVGQSADITIDAMPGKTFHGTVTLVGDQALLRSTGIATSQSTTGTEEAKDFKVIVTLSDPSNDLRPGLSCTAKITTAHKADVLTLPIEALTMHDPADDKAPAKAAKTDTASATRVKPNPVQGVFVAEKDSRGRLRAKFVPVTTGITGATDIEVLSGLKPGDEIVTGPYKILRGLKGDALLKRDTQPLSLNTGSSS